MEEIMSRFPHLAEAVFDSLKYESLKDCKGVSRSWYNYLDEQKFFHIRSIQATVFHELGDTWKQVFKLLDTPTIMELKYAVKKVYLHSHSHFKHHESLTPLHVVAETGPEQLFMKIFEKMEDKNPKTENGETPLHIAASYGNFELCKIIIETVDDKNPGNSSQITPLHPAAFKGHFKICEYIISKVKDKNPRDISGMTPLHKPAQNGHLQIYELIRNNVTEKNPRCGGGWTPIRLLEEHQCGRGWPPKALMPYL